MNANNYELLEVRQYAEKDGKTYLLGINRFQYDLPEPEEVSSFLKQFDKSDSTKANITYIANPGKENEITATIAVPPYSIVSYYSQDIPEADVFIDSDCTKLANSDWDGKSDITYYVVPHKE